MMIVYNGMDKDLCCTKGSGKYQYKIGRTEKTEHSKTRNDGFHASEYIIECLRWYPLGQGSRYLKCYAGGDINEDGEDIVSCTELLPVKELNLLEVVFEAMCYMVKYPQRKWEGHGTLFSVCEESAEAPARGFAIARGNKPMCKGGKGAYLGFLREEETGVFTAIRLREVGASGIEPGRWYTLNEDGEVVEA